MRQERIVSEGSLIWPNFYVVGAAKAGTTSVWAYLKKHPQVFFPRVKEPGFFMSYPLPPEYESERFQGFPEKYRRLFEGAVGYKAIGDATTGYLWDPKSAQLIHEVCSDAKIVIMLRDPVERAYSHYYMFASVGLEKLPFLEAVNRNHAELSNGNPQWNLFMYLEYGLYYEQVLRYIELFGRENVGIYLFDDLENDPRRVMTGICNHIGVDPALLAASEFSKVHNPGRVPRVKWLYDAARSAVGVNLRSKILPRSAADWLRYNPIFYKREKPPRDERAAKFLQSIYAPDVSRLEELLGRKIPELRKTWL
jgi:hypothetical protein